MAKKTAEEALVEADDDEEDQEEVETKPKKKTEQIEKTSVVTQTAPAFKLPDGSVVSLDDYLIWMGNEVIKIRRAVA